MFKVGDLVYLRPVSLHTPGVLPRYEYDMQLLLDTRARMHMRGDGSFNRIFEWFVRDYVDWSTECLLPKPVYIASSYIHDALHYVGIFYAFPNVRWGDIPWALSTCALEYHHKITQTRRLTVKRGSSYD